MKKETKNEIKDKKKELNDRENGIFPSTKVLSTERRNESSIIFRRMGEEEKSLSGQRIDSVVFFSLHGYRVDKNVTQCNLFLICNRASVGDRHDIEPFRSADLISHRFLIYFFSPSSVLTLKLIV